MTRLLPLVLFTTVAVLSQAADEALEVKTPPDYNPAMIRPRIDWRNVVTYPPTEPGNAAEQYVEIARNYLAGRGVRWPEGKVSPVLLELAKAGARRRECDFGCERLIVNGVRHRLLPATSPDDLVGHLAPLRAVGRALRAEGDKLYRDGKVEEAVRAYESAVILGARLVEGRESLIQVLVGISIQYGYKDKKRHLKAAIQSLYRSEGNARKHDQWEQYWDSLEQFRKRLEGKTKRITAASESGDKRAKPEDIEFALAVLLHDEDPMMKREAILALSTLREPSEKVKAALRHAEMSDSDPYVSVAAANALRNMESTI